MRIDWRHPRTQRWLLWVLFGVLLVPFLALSAFVYPTTDDYCFGRIWRQMGYWRFQSHFYQTWSGRYTGNLIMSTNPLNFGWWWAFRVAPVLTFGLYVFVLQVFFRELTQRQLPDRGVWALTALFLFVLLAQHPGIAFYFYWYTGHLYTFADLASLLAVVSWIRYEISTGRRRTAHFALTALLIFFIMGCNEVPLVMNLTLLAALVFFSLLRERRLRFDSLALLLVGAAGAALAILAPGNRGRATSGTFGNDARQGDLVYTLTHAPLEAFNSLVTLLPLVLVASVLLVPLGVQLVRLAPQVPGLARVFGANPLHVGLTYAAMLVVGFVPTFWAVGTLPPPLPKSVIYFWLVLGWFYLTLVLVFWYERRRPAALPFRLPMLVSVALGLYLALSLAGSFNFRSAYSDLLTGRAYRFSREMATRIDFLRTSPDAVVTVPALQNLPVTIVPLLPARDMVIGHPDDGTTCGIDFFGKKGIEYVGADGRVVGKP